MRILPLTFGTETHLLKRRTSQNRAAYLTAQKIVCDVRRRGDDALDQGSRELDGVDLQRQGLWVSRREMAAAKKRVSADFLRAVAHAARRGGLSIHDFVKQISTQTIDRTGFERLADDVRTLAQAEGLLAHANAVGVRR